MASITNEQMQSGLEVVGMAKLIFHLRNSDNHLIEETATVSQ
jgi:hypothetical protein